MDRTYRQAAGIFFRSAANLGRELREASLPGSRQGMFDWPEYSGKPDWQYAGFLIPALSLFYQGVLCVVRGRLLELGEPLPESLEEQIQNYLRRDISELKDRIAPYLTGPPEGGIVEKLLSQNPQAESVEELIGWLLQPLPRNNGGQVLVPVPSLEISREEFRRRLRILIREAGGIAGYLEKMSADTGDHKPGTARED